MNYNRHRTILTNGTIITVEGTGQSSYNGDYQDATIANVNTPSGILVRSNGEMIVSETGRHTIRVVLTDGTIIPYAGDAMQV